MARQGHRPDRGEADLVRNADRNPIYRFGGFELDPRAAELRREGRPLRVPRRVFDLLLHLLENRDRVVSRQELLARVWQGVHVAEGSLYQAVAQARRVLALGGGEPPIALIRGRGYRFTAAVAETPAAGASGDFVGRDAALADLRRWLEDARAGDPRTVLVTGPAGVGKTALVDHFLRTARASGDLPTARAECLETYGASEAYRPLLEAVADLCERADGAELLEALRHAAPTWLARLPALLTPEERTRFATAAHRSHRHRMVRELVDAVQSAARRRPLVLVIEDLHWSDPSTLDAIHGLARRASDGASLLLLLTARTDEIGPAAARVARIAGELERSGRGRTLPLPCLQAAEVEAFLRHRFPKGFPRELARWLSERSGGNPLFLIGLLDHLRERGVVQSGVDGSVALAGSLRALVDAIPGEARQLVERRVETLDRGDRALLRAASVAGDECCAALVTAAFERDWSDVSVVAEVENELSDLAGRCSLLVSAGLDEWPDGTVSARFRFAHHLQREAVYDALAPAERARLHRRVGDCLEKAFGQQVPEVASSLAHHFARGRDPRRALEYHVAALQQACDRCAPEEALEIAEGGLELLPRLPERAREALELRLRRVLGPTLARAPAHPAAESNCERAIELGRRTGSDSHIGSMLWVLGYFAYQRGQRERALALSRELLALGEERGEEDWILLGRDSLGRSHQAQCEMAAALPHADFVWESYDAERHRPLALQVGQDIRMNSGITSAFALWELGRFREAHARMEAALEHARTIGHTYSASLALLYGSLFFYSALDRGRAGAIAAEARTRAAELELEIDEAFASFLIAACDPPGAARLAALQRALARLQAAEGAERESSGGRISVLIVLAQTLLHEDRRADALAAADAGLALVGATGDRLLEPGLLATRGIALADPDDGEAHLRRALAGARELGFRLTGLRVTRYLARHLAARGRRAEAAALLVEGLAGYEHELEIPDLADARHLLSCLETGSRAPVDPMPPSFRDD